MLMKSWPTRVILAVAAVVVAGGIVLHFHDRRRTQATDTAAAISQTSGSAPSRNSTSRNRTAPASEETEAQANEAANPLQVPHEKIEEYLKLHHRDSASLLAAFHAAFDPEHPGQGLDYLKEAATNFPGDPQVQLTVLAQDAFPEDRRKWLDAFKTSSPSNSLANYLSAREYFKNNQQEAAMKELLEASGKGQFADYAMESYLGAAELSRFAGASPIIATTAAMSAMAGDLLPELSNLKGIAQGIRDAQKQYVDSGDNVSVQNLSQMGLGLASRLTSGEGGRFVISQMVGAATETIALQALEQNTSYDFLGGKSPAQRLEELKQQKLDIKALAGGFSSAFVNATEAERDSYAERMKIYGEVAAMRWLQQQHPAGSTPGQK
jgi:hypothetical protein